MANYYPGDLYDLIEWERENNDFEAKRKEAVRKQKELDDKIYNDPASKDIFIKFLNTAIQLYAENGGKVYEGDQVVDYNSENVKIAPFIDRHPGWIKFYVKLEEGSGLFFVKCNSYMMCNIYFIAWESDNVDNRDSFEIMENAYGALREKDCDLFDAYCRYVDRILEDLISKGLYRS